jgi:hypothetical protein
MAKCWSRLDNCCVLYTWFFRHIKIFYNSIFLVKTQTNCESMDVFQPTYLWKKNEKIKSSRDRQKVTCQLYFFSLVMSVAIPINCKFVRKIMINHRIFGCHLCNCTHVSLPRPELKPCDSKLEMTRFSKAHALCPKKVLGSEGVHDIRPLDNQIKIGTTRKFHDPDQFCLI